MIPTPEQVVPLVLPVVPDLTTALRRAIDHADTIQPDPTDRDPWYWSHSARWKARNELRACQDEGWSLVPQVANCGIHLRLGTMHVVRVLRTLDGTTPHPGSNNKRREAWRGVQGQLLLADGDLPPLSVIADWHEIDGEPQIHLGLPTSPWKFGHVARLHWRIPLPEDGVNLDALTFDPGPDHSDSLVRLAIDPAEETGA